MDEYKMPKLSTVIVRVLFDVLYQKELGLLGT